MAAVIIHGTKPTSIFPLVPMSKWNRVCRLDNWGI